MREPPRFGFRMNLAMKKLPHPSFPRTPKRRGPAHFSRATMTSKVLAFTFSLFLAGTQTMANETQPKSQSGLQTITLGAGCFWCVEAVFQRINGVKTVISGYMGGEVANPTYKAVCTGQTGHAEVVRISYDPSAVDLERILGVFWEAHDPTTLNRQGADVGTQYRSAIFYEDEAQREIAVASKQKADSSGKFRSPIVTEITPAEEFYEAEDYHQDYYELNKSYPYCQAVITPKLKKLGLE